MAEKTTRNTSRSSQKSTAGSKSKTTKAKAPAKAKTSTRAKTTTKAKAPAKAKTSTRAKPATKSKTTAKSSSTAKRTTAAKSRATGTAGAKAATTKKAAAKAPARRRKPASPFKVGDKVVHPHHGAAIIIKREKHEFDGAKTDYFVLEVATDQLIVRLPIEKAEEIGVRPVISKNAAKKVFATFRDEPQEAGSNWSRWYKILTEKITSGDIYQVAEVVRDLTYAQQTKGISPALKRMLSKARLTLTSELRFALDISEEDATKRLDKALPKVEVDDESA